MSSWTPQSLRYVGLQQATAAPSGYDQTAAAPNAASTFSRNGVWPMAAETLVVAVPLQDLRTGTPAVRKPSTGD